jgi:hypothetical protein
MVQSFDASVKAALGEPMSPLPSTVDDHFTDRSPVVRRIYDRLLAVAGTFGPFTEDPKKTSIHLNRQTAFAGVATRKDLLILTIKADHDIRSGRVARREKTSAHRWHLEIKLSDPAQIDAELTGWLKDAYDLSA